MLRKFITLFVILLFTLLLVTACSPAEDEYATDEPFYEETDVPVTDEAINDIPVSIDEASPVCMSQLEPMLSDEDDSEASDSLPTDLDQEYILVTYQVSGNKISSPKLEDNVPDELVQYQEDTATQDYIWKFFTDVVPADQREMVSEFVVFSDGYSNTIGAVDEGDKANSWTFEMDIIDSQDLSTMATTILHEFGHILTLNDQQLDDKALSCSNYTSIDGCTRSDSYLNAFYNDYWLNIYAEWAATVEFSDGEVNEDQVSVFYEQYPDQFVSDYAPTGPEEDIAESWIYFIFSPKPAGDTIAEQKILFFYDYPELVDLRLTILSALCQYTQQ